MGWTFPYDRPHRKDLITELTKNQDWKREDGTQVESRAIKHCYKGGVRSGVLYVVWERKQIPVNGDAKAEKFIGVYLLQYRKDRQLGSTWGYKDMDCCCGPCQLSCPVSYLDLCPPHEGSQWCKGWHEKVRANADARKANRERVKGLKVNDIVQLAKGCNVPSLRIVTVRPLVGESGYRNYKVQPRLIDWEATARLHLSATAPEDYKGLPLK